MLFHDFIKASKCGYKLSEHETETTIPIENAIIAVGEFAASHGSVLLSCQLGTKLLKNYEPYNKESYSGEKEAIEYFKGFQESPDFIDQRISAANNSEFDVVMHHAVQREIDCCTAALDVAGQAMEALRILAEGRDMNGVGLPFHTMQRGFPPKGNIPIFSNTIHIGAEFLKAHNIPIRFATDMLPRSNILFQIIEMGDTMREILATHAKAKMPEPATA